jgi:uncharacterized membrane protein (DUF373 family)
LRIHKRDLRRGDAFEREPVRQSFLEPAAEAIRKRHSRVSQRERVLLRWPSQARSWMHRRVRRIFQRHRNSQRPVKLLGGNTEFFCQFQSVFGEILTLLIALEFNHTLQYVVKRQQSIIQTQVVLLIALLAIARKFIVLDLGSVDAAQLLGLAAITLGLGIAYWLIRERDDRTDIASNNRAE